MRRQEPVLGPERDSHGRHRRLPGQQPDDKARPGDLPWQIQSDNINAE